MNVFRLPDQWRSAFERDSAEKPALPDPVPERRLARLLAAYVVSGLFFMILPGTVLGVWKPGQATLPLRSMPNRASGYYSSVPLVG